MRTLIWSGPALREIAAIASFYAKIDPSVSKAVVERIKATPLPLLEQPFLGPPIGLRDARKWEVKGYPYLLRYRVTARWIEILRVHHDRQDWRTR